MIKCCFFEKSNKIILDYKTTMSEFVFDYCPSKWSQEIWFCRRYLKIVWISSSLIMFLHIFRLSWSVITSCVISLHTKCFMIETRNISFDLQLNRILVEHKRVNPIEFKFMVLCWLAHKLKIFEFFEECHECNLIW